MFESFQDSHTFVMEVVDMTDSKSVAEKACRFESDQGYLIKIVWWCSGNTCDFDSHIASSTLARTAMLL